MKISSTLTRGGTLFLLSILFLISCKKDVPETPPAEEIPDLIASVSFKKYDGLLLDSTDLTINYYNDTIDIMVQPGTCLEKLTPI